MLDGFANPQAKHYAKPSGDVPGTQCSRVTRAAPRLTRTHILYEGGGAWCSAMRGVRGVRAWLALAALWGLVWRASGGPGPPVELRFSSALYNLSIPENSPPRTYALQPPADDPLGVRLPAPDARVRFRIRHGDKDKFFKAEERTVGDFCFLSIRTRAGHADVLNRERRDLYRLDVRATAQLANGRQLEADTVLVVSIADENDLSPLFYPTEYEAVVPEDAPLHSSIARVTAEDADLGLNGEIYYSLAEPTDRFAIHPTTGVITITRPLSATESTRHTFAVLARDRASLLARGEEAPAARATVSVRVKRVNLHAPVLHVRRMPELVENSTAEIYAIIAVTDEDDGEHGRIASLEIVDGDPDGHFRVRPSAQAGEYDVLVHALLDRESAPAGYNLTLRAQDAGRPPRASYLTLPVTLVDANDNAPVFSREVYEASIPETVPPNTPVIRLKVSDRDEGRNARVYIEVVGGNEGEEFYVNPDTGVLYTAVSLDAEDKALYTLTVSAIDQGNAGTRKQSSAKVKITILDSNDNDPIFEREVTEVTVQENGPSGAVVARVVARDADSGDNAYISYSIANLQPVPFDVDHFSGAVRTTRLLDYESMRREYTLRIRASDWGVPYRRQAEMRLVVRLEDVNDNRPQFERVDCVGYLPRKLIIGSEIVTLSAIDFDAGDVVSYRIIGGNEDNCFALDAGTGVMSLSCDLSDVRADSRLLNVTATDGTHFADATALTLHLVSSGGSGSELSSLECRDTGVARRLTELLAAAERSNAPQDLSDEFSLAPSRYGENLHAPEFLDFPVEVKVNESVALGTSLVKLRARDRDLGYNGLLVYGISGGDADSAFRIDPDSGELQVIGYLDRERESEYYLNITVYDLGTPQHSVSRLLPVTILDVNDNTPRFEKTLASFRVTENALNGTAIFRANATDRDAGDFARITYSVSGADDGEFCVERDSGVLRVCAALDRERRALYELSLRAADGGGLHAEALVRVAVDDVNDNAPRFALATYGARAREDVPVGTLVAVVEAFDPDLGAGGTVTYSLPDQAADDVVFTIDTTSGTLRTAKLLDFEERQVVDVDENAHAPQFSDHAVLAGSVREDAERATVVLTAAASDADPPGRDSRLAYYIVAGSGMAHFSVDDAGVIRTLTPLDRESVPHYWLTLCAQDHGLVPRHSCVQVYIEVEDVNDMVPWPEQAAYWAAVAEHCPAGTRVATVRATDADAAPTPANITYSIVAGNPDGLFSIDEHTGEVVTTGRTLDREAGAGHALEVQASDGALASTARLVVRLLDVNDHAPAFAQRFYDIRVPAPLAPPAPSAPRADALPQGDEADGDEALPVADESSTEWEAEDDEEGSGVRAPWDFYDDPVPVGHYVATVVAFDSDEGANGTVRYWARARGAARGLLRVHAASGRLLLAPRLALAPGDSYDVTLRACDAAARPRCSVARAVLRGVARAGARRPGWRPRRRCREDGSLVLARRLLWERQPQYCLNVSVTDGHHVVYAPVNITVINDANEGGVAFTQDEYIVETSEATRVGEALVALRATGAGRLLYGVHAARAPASARLFRLHELSGVLELAHALDRESAAVHELTVWARDQAPRAARAYARVIVRVHDADEHAPEWGRRLAESAPAARGAGRRAGGRAARRRPRRGRRGARGVLAGGGDAGGTFTVDAALGDVRLARALPAAGPRDYTLAVRAANPAPGARWATLPLHVVVVEAADAAPRFVAADVSCEVFENEPAGAALAALEVRSASAPWFSLEGGEGLFRLNPAAGLLATAAPLDYETQNFYNLTVTAINMGGGRAVARVGVHVLDRNEFPPALRRAQYRGRVAEDAAPGALVADADAGAAPLVLLTDDADSPANRQRAYEILQPAAAAQFRVDPTTGALHLLARLDYERAQRHEFSVRVIDMGTPRLPSGSVAKVVVEVTDVNDCPPEFSQAEYSATVLLPTSDGVAVARLAAHDPDLAPGARLKYDIIEGDPDAAFALSDAGELRVARAAALQSARRLRVRASDGLYSATARVDVRVAEADNSGLAFQKADYYGSVVENSTKPTTVAVLNRVARARLHVAVTDVNDNCPVFVERPYAAAVLAGAPPGTAVLRVRAVDLDANDNGEVRYEMKRGHGELFRVDRRSGQISLKQTLDAHSQLYWLDIAALRRRRAGLRRRGARGPPDRSNGPCVLAARAALDYETARSHELVVRATDGVTGAFADAALSLRVLDVNDCAPEFPRDVYRATVSEAAPRGELVLTLHARDNDTGENGQVTYSLSEMDTAAEGAFTIDAATGTVRVAAPLDRETRAHYHLLVTATDAGRPPLVTTAHLFISLDDVNDSPPSVERGVVPALVSAEAARGTELARVAAWDPDERDATRLHFALEGAAPQRAFAVDARTGVVSLAAGSGWAGGALRSLNVSVSDGAHAAFARVKLSLAPANRSPPHFPHVVHEARALENQPPPLLLTTVKAYDDDPGEYGTVTYSIPSARLRETFAIDASSGALSTRVALDREARADWDVPVTASDGGGLVRHTVVRVRVADLNDNAPEFPLREYRAAVRCDRAPRLPFLTLAARDADAGEHARLHYSVYEGDARADTAGLFAVDAHTGALSFARDATPFASRSVQVWVRARDGGGLAGEAPVSVFVLGANDEAPRVLAPPADLFLREDAAPGTLVAELRAPEPGAPPPRYRLAPALWARDLFAIDESGRLVLAGQLDRETAAEHIIVMADDPDAGTNGEVRYSLAHEGDDGDVADGALFAVDPYTGWVTTLGDLDREARAEHRLALLAADGGSPRRVARGTLVLRLLDYNDCPPAFAAPAPAAAVREDAAPGTVVLRLAVRDADAAGAPLAFFVAAGDPRARFQLRASGELYVARALDRELEPRYSLRVAATDGKFTAHTDVHVDVLDVNDNPPYCLRHRYYARLPEDAANGTRVMTLETGDADEPSDAGLRYYLTGEAAHHFLIDKVHATDADLGENRLVRYSFVEETSEVFELAADSGIVTLRAALDRETQAEHRVLVRAQDAGRPPRSATATLRLTVADVNDNPPEFEFHQYRATVPELDAPGTEVLRVRATSRDAGVNADVYYSLVGGDDRDDFAVDRASGVLSVARSLDYERRQHYLLTVQAVDGGTPPLSDLATLNISVADGNDNAPQFSQAQYGARVREDAAVGARVLQVVADDADAGANARVSYSIARGDRDGRFAIDADTGYVSLAAALDRETAPAYVLEVRARDHGLPALEATALVNIEVVDANDNPPLFAQSNYSAVVQEDRPLGHTILKFVVEDADAPPNAAPYTFDFQSGNEMGAFRLEQDGYLRSATRFNHRIKDRYVLQVRVFDNGTPPLYSDAWVYIRVIEESQYPPVVTPLEVVVNSYLDEFPGGIIGRVYASDRDAYDTLTYSIAPVDGAPYPPTDLFEIDPSDGTLKAAPRLDVGEYRLNVTVDDGKFLGYAIVKVTVILISDEMLAQAIVVRFREVTDRDFILSHRKGFIRAIAEATDCEPGDVVIVSVQPSGDADDDAARARRQVAQDLDVAFAVRAAAAFLPADALRRRLHAHLERLEERARLVVEELLRAACGGCVHGACAERVQLGAAPRATAAEVFALVAPPHRLVARCACAPGYGGERCDRAPAACADCRGVAALAGDGYLQYRLERGALQGARLPDDELALSLRFRTRRDRGTLLYAAGRVDYAVLEVAEGYLQFRMELGAGPAAVRAAVPVSDGLWHEARLERRGASMRLTVDRRSALAQTPGPAAVLDVRADRLLLGAELTRHAHAFAAEQVTYGFHGCISDVKLGGALLPLEEGESSTDGRAQLVRRVRVRVGAACPALPPPTPCASYPCLNGGSCRDLADLLEAAEPDEGYACTCHARFSGRRCELDGDPCASQPCLHGGSCAAAAGGFRCACAAGLGGARCERGRWCAAGVCAHGGACEEGDWGPSCRCRGYYGPRCQYDVDECAGEPCLNGATCVNEPGSFRCLCPPDKTVSSYLLNTDDYCARTASDSEQLRARTLREPDAASLITMLEERNSLLGGDDDGSGSELSANLCEIEESDAETEPALSAPRHTDV
ncbi:unnamed protein product [Spodoptera littoralis]|uniref:Fat-like cadherin-related tumor suppressor homolog n=1 Tax=Spodoptera littoralis TaxID=7109 RepID=A0A9P0HVG9_SPOLI|nr:unnamed protein product [Spodoptera littoralis]CAH1634963.1 unnamed protein product [Spodoptera littoralis]